jgi:prophage regulatory protein
MADQFLRTRETTARVKLGRTTIWRMEKAGTFPRRRQIGNGIVGWLESEVDEWIRSRPVVASGNPDADTPR